MKPRYLATHLNYTVQFSLISYIKIAISVSNEKMLDRFNETSIKQVEFIKMIFSQVKNSFMNKTLLQYLGG